MKEACNNKHWTENQVIHYRRPIPGAFPSLRIICCSNSPCNLGVEMDPRQSVFISLKQGASEALAKLMDFAEIDPDKAA